jgi:ABC-type branched-subunit amino acid transport system ATPase component
MLIGAYSDERSPHNSSREPDAWRHLGIAAVERFAEIQDLFPVLAARRYQIAGTLSGGEQKMCAIGRALMMVQSC